MIFSAIISRVTLGHFQISLRTIVTTDPFNQHTGFMANLQKAFVISNSAEID